MLVRSLSGKDPLEEGTATHYSILASRILQREPHCLGLHLHSFSKEKSPNTWLWNGLMNEDLELRSSKSLRKEKFQRYLGVRILLFPMMSFSQGDGGKRKFRSGNPLQELLEKSAKVLSFCPKAFLQLSNLSSVSHLFYEVNQMVSFFFFFFFFLLFCPSLNIQLVTSIYVHKAQCFAIYF